LGVKILMAAKKGGVEPDKNIELARALKEAYSVSLPKENIERALKKATEVTSDEEYRPGDYEVFGVGGVGIIVRTLTDNTNRAVGQIKAAARKHEVKMASAGSVLFLFDLKGIIHLQPAATPHSTTTTTTTTTATTSNTLAATSSPTSVDLISEERLLEIALDLGVDDVDIIYPTATSTTDDSEPSSPISPLPTVLTSPQCLGILQDALAHQLTTHSTATTSTSTTHPHTTANAHAHTHAHTPSGSGRVGDAPVAVTVTGELGYIPRGELVTVSEEDWARNQELVEVFEELEDVDRVYHNMQTVL
jgi:transcriptional/translational regulatory protein YebC/TACO1